MVVSLTSTVNSVFGSHVLDPDTGIIFNDEVSDMEAWYYALVDAVHRWMIFLCLDNRTALGCGPRPVRTIRVIVEQRVSRPHFCRQFSRTGKTPSLIHYSHNNRIPKRHILHCYWRFRRLAHFPVHSPSHPQY